MVKEVLLVVKAVIEFCILNINIVVPHCYLSYVWKYS